MKYVTKSMNPEFQAIMKRHRPTTVTLRPVLKSGKLGKPFEATLYGSETTAEEAIARLERNNPGRSWVKA